jgi:hypothetical protein
VRAYGTCGVWACKFRAELPLTALHSGGQARQHRVFRAGLLPLLHLHMQQIALANDSSESLPQDGSNNAPPELNSDKAGPCRLIMQRQVARVLAMAALLPLGIERDWLPWLSKASESLDCRQDQRMQCVAFVMSSLVLWLLIAYAGLPATPLRRC